jgi:hypothetical protein
MSRELTSHKVNGLNEAIKIEVLDEPGAGGANHEYLIAAENSCLHISFQNGPIAEAGVNGISQEALLAVVEDRLKGFQSGPYACEDNAMALLSVQVAMSWLKHRTEGRVERGVEGTSAK